MVHNGYISNPIRQKDVIYTYDNNSEEISHNRVMVTPSLIRGCYK